MRNNYDWLLEHLLPFFKAVNFPNNEHCNTGVITAHGDKCYGYRSKWNQHSIPFEHGVALYLLTYYRPYTKEVRQTTNGWVAPDDWVVANYLKFVDLLPPLTVEPG